MTEAAKRCVEAYDKLKKQLEQIENKRSELLPYATGGRFSKVGYSIDDMRRFVDDYNQTTCEKCDKLEEGSDVGKED